MPSQKSSLCGLIRRVTESPDRGYIHLVPCQLLLGRSIPPNSFSVLLPENSSWHLLSTTELSLSAGNTTFIFFATSQTLGKEFTEQSRTLGATYIPLVDIFPM